MRSRKCEIIIRPFTRIAVLTDSSLFVIWENIRYPVTESVRQTAEAAAKQHPGLNGFTEPPGGCRTEKEEFL
jgi:hypothetical protein